MSINNNDQQSFNQEKNFHNAFLIIPSSLAYHKEIDDSTKLLYGSLNSLSNIKGYCFASDSYLAELTGVTEKELNSRLKTLEDFGFIKRFSKKNGLKWDRKIFTSNNYAQIPKIIKDEEFKEEIKKMFTKYSNGYFEGIHINTFEVSTGIPYINKNNNNKSNNICPTSSLASEDAHFCSNYLFEKVKTVKKNAKEPKWDSWNKTLERMIRIDKIPKEKIIEAIDFVYRRGSTWAVQSADSLREKYERIDFHIQKEKQSSKPQFNPINNEEDKKIASVVGIVNHWLLNVTKDPIKINMGALKIEDKKIIGPYGRFYKKNFNELMMIVKDVYKAPDGLLDQINKKCSHLDNITKVYNQRVI